MRRAALALVVVAPLGAADANVCRFATLDFVPAEQPTEPALRFPLQIVAWLEDSGGTFVDTMFITQATGRFGLGNRPGRFDFNSGPGWPYGRRITTFPVWAHRHGLSFPEVVFQDDREDDLSGGAFIFASNEPHYCRPMQRSEPAWDAGTCASPQIFTDKGKLGAGTSLYPPRADVEAYAVLDPFDAVSQATPPSGVPAIITWTAPVLPDGSYSVLVEVAREFDSNASYSFAGPTGIPWTTYGLPYRGQPSVVYRVPITLGAGDTTATTDAYIGYGDPDGLDGNLRAPDATITSDLPGSGAGRLALTSDGYRIRVAVHSETDAIAPAAPGDLAVLDLGTTTATLAFVAPGDDGTAGNRIARYEARIRTGAGEITEANFADSPLLVANIAVGEPGSATNIALTDLVPGTPQSVGVRAVDNCGNVGPVAVLSFTTSDRAGGDVDACFIATAAYGSTLAGDVAMLRRFRDTVLQHSALGELAVEGYYTFGPPVAQVIGESDLLRATARHFVGPLVEAVKAVTVR